MKWKLRTEKTAFPLSSEFSRQEYWIGLPFRPPGDGPNPGIEPLSLVSPALAKGFFTTVPAGKAPFEFIQPPEEQHPSPARYFPQRTLTLRSPKPTTLLYQAGCFRMAGGGKDSEFQKRLLIATFHFLCSEFLHQKQRVGDTRTIDKTSRNIACGEGESVSRVNVCPKRRKNHPFNNQICPNYP